MSAPPLADRLQNFAIYVGSTSPATDPNFFSTAGLCYSQSAAQSTLKATYACATPLTGRYLAVRLLGSGELVLTLCEVAFNGAAPAG